MNRNKNYMALSLVEIIKNHDRGKYSDALQLLADQGLCPLCPKALKVSQQSALHSYQGWSVVLNAFPYEHSSAHLLLIPRKHKETLADMSTSDWAAVGHLAKWIIRKYTIPGGALAVRFGDSAYSGGSVQHLHFHLIEPLSEPNQAPERVSFLLGSKPV